MKVARTTHVEHISFGLKFPYDAWMYIYVCIYIYIRIYIYIYTYIGLCSHLDSWQTTLDYDQFMSQLVKALVHLFGDAEEEVLANAHHALQVCTCVCM